jgi:hypothetical protein
MDMNTAYFIDSENVGVAWTREGILFDDTDEIFVVKNITGQKLSADFMKSTLAKINNIVVETGHNSADILIAGIIGSLLGKFDSFVIISNDKGYKSFIKYFSDNYKCDIQRKGLSNQFTSEKVKKRKAKIKESNLDESQKNYVLSLMNNYQYNSYIKQKIHDKLCKKYGNSEGEKVYSVVKRYIK